MNKQDVLASVQLLAFNPILKESKNIQTRYYSYLEELLEFAEWNRGKYTNAQLTFYRERLCDSSEFGGNSEQAQLLDVRFCYLLPYDLALMLGFREDVLESDELRAVISKMVTDFHLPNHRAVFIYFEFETAFGFPNRWNYVLNYDLVQEFQDYLELVKKNISFMKRYPYRILITATMSAGKSTLINALIGKNISRMQNMACTSKIHTIVSKRFEDGLTSKYDDDLLMDASDDSLLSYNDGNESSEVAVGTYFHGLLSGKRITFLDSPGVNSSENKEHTRISRQMIAMGNYDLMLYVLNATQLGTTDEERHLEVVKKSVSNSKIIFIMNKADLLLSDEDGDISQIIERQKKFLVSKGFSNPIICPVSSRAAYLVKKSQYSDISRLEDREMMNYMDKFEECDFAPYYQKHFGYYPITTDNEEEALWIHCGFAYLERIIRNMYNGGRIYDSGVC